MNNILITSDSRYPISRPKIKNAIKSLLKENKVVSDVEVSVMICGIRKAADIAKEYLHDDKPHNVLSFVLSEKSDPKNGNPPLSPSGNFLAPRSNDFPANNETIMLGDIVVCYPIAQEEANRDNIMLDVKINELVSHGLHHLLGQHHEEN